MISAHGGAAREWGALPLGTAKKQTAQLPLTRGDCAVQRYGCARQDLNLR